MHEWLWEVLHLFCDDGAGLLWRLVGLAKEEGQKNFMRRNNLVAHEQRSHTFPNLQVCFGFLL